MRGGASTPMAWRGLTGEVWKVLAQSGKCLGLSSPFPEAHSLPPVLLQIQERAQYQQGGCGAGPAHQRPRGPPDLEPAGAFPRWTERSKVVSLPFWRWEAGAETLLLPVGGVRWSHCGLRGHPGQEGQQTRPAHLAGRSLGPGGEPGKQGPQTSLTAPPHPTPWTENLPPAPERPGGKKERQGSRR